MTDALSAPFAARQQERPPAVTPAALKGGASITILDAVADPNLFAPWFKDADTWAVWFVFLAVLFGLPISEAQAAIFRKHTGRDALPTEAFTEADLIVGRRGGKSFILALLGVFLACFREYRQFLQPGERATVMVIAADRRQARVILRYVSGLLNNVPMLKAMVEREAADGFDLKNSVTIEVGTASFRTTRGYTFAAVLADEVAFWRSDDSANPDSEILAAVRPGLASIPGAMLLCASSPYAKRGELYKAFKKWWGKDGAPLVWKAPTRDMNPTIRQSVIEDALAEDAAAASAEYLAEFRNDIEQFVSLEVVEKCVATGITERPRDSRFAYEAFTDPSGGSNDAFTLAIAHSEDGRAVIDVARERKPPFSPEAVVAEYAALLKAYGIRSVRGDRYAGEFPRELFRKCGIEYRISDKARSEIYLTFLPMLNSRSVELLDVPHLVPQIVGLERRVARSGRESIDHAPNGHDDLANSVAGVATMLVNRPKAETKIGFCGMGGPVKMQGEDESLRINIRRYTEKEWLDRQKTGAT